MRIRIIIDTQDADEPDALESQMPFTLNAYSDDDDGTHSYMPMEIDNEGCLIGNNIAHMLQHLAAAWEKGHVLDSRDEPIPNTAEQWREIEEG